MPGKWLQQEQRSHGAVTAALGLTASGVLAALLTGVAAIAAGGAWLVLLLLYFGAATTVSRLRRDAKVRKAGGLPEKSGSRDAAQVLANGGAFAAGAVMYALTREPVWVAFAAGALAASSADTWATELGLLSSEVPRSIVTAKPVQAGASGGVTLAGTGAGILGALIVSAGARLLGLDAPLWVLLIGGVAGMLADSIIGATVQEQRWCPACDRGTERLVHVCGHPSEFIGGVPGLRNDLVNALATLSGGAVSVGLLTVLA